MKKTLCIFLFLAAALYLTLYLKHCKVLKVNTLRQPDNKPRKYRNNVTRIKAELRAKLPISSYIGLIKLEPGKYDSISEGAEW